MGKEHPLPLFDELPVDPHTDLVCADVLAWAESYTGSPFMALLCDGPYSLGDGKTGFMNSPWDTNICFRPETWKALAAHLLPGAFGFAFASSRGWHRLACAIEDAGFILHPSIFLYTYGSGFPKATRIKDAEVFHGHRYGLQALKPSAEPILCFQKPYQGKPVQSIVEHGAGALWIDGGRLPNPTGESAGGGWGYAGRTEQSTYNNGWQDEDGKFSGSTKNSAGRWPPNFALTHHPACQRVGTRQVKAEQIDSRGHAGEGFGMKPQAGHDYADTTGHETVSAYHCHDSCPVAAFDRQAGYLHGPGFRKGPGGHSRQENQSIFTNAKGGIGQGDFGGARYGDSGAASRFFHVSDFALEVEEQLAQAAPTFYCAKASRRERDAGLEGMPRKPGLEQCLKPLSDPRMDRPQQRIMARNNHPCIKPITLTRWLATLLLPPAAYAPRRLLNVFAGSGSEGIGATLAGWDEIVCVEREAEYVDIAQKRLAYWTTRRGSV